MPVTDPISDLLTRIRNAQLVKHKTVRVLHSKMAKRFLEVLQQEGFIQGYETRKDAQDKFDEIEVSLRYYKNGAPVIGEATRVSKPGIRKYANGENLPKVHSGLGIAVISTSQGVMSDREARHRKIGGEVLAFIS